MRELTTHVITDADASIKLRSDDPGHGGAAHDYRVTFERDGASVDLGRIAFQTGPVGEFGVNGLTHEVLLSILIDRLGAFQLGPYPSRYNADALQHCHYAQAALFQRTKDRMAAGVEGKAMAHDPAVKSTDASAKHPEAALASMVPSAEPGPHPGEGQVAAGA